MTFDPLPPYMPRYSAFTSLNACLKDIAKLDAPFGTLIANALRKHLQHLNMLNIPPDMLGTWQHFLTQYFNISMAEPIPESALTALASKDQTYLNALLNDLYEIRSQLTDPDVVDIRIDSIRSSS